MIKISEQSQASTPSIDEQQQWEKKLAHADREIEILEDEKQALIEQVVQLKFDIAHSQRVRSLFKSLARALDAAILIRISRLNKPRAIKKQSLHLPATKDPKKVLRALRLYDLGVYYNSRSKDRLLYKFVNGSYMLTTRSMLKWALKFIPLKKG
jgi:hypothetical protein